MSSAFVKESEEQWLHEIPPTMTALINYLTRENNGVRISERSSYKDETTGKLVYRMSNGLSYTVNADNHWMIAD
jgi:hypothetical protein